MVVVTLPAGDSTGILAVLTVSDLDATEDLLVTGCFGGEIKVWSFREEEEEEEDAATKDQPLPLVLTIKAGHAVNCVSACPELRLVASCSRTGR